MHFAQIDGAGGTWRRSLAFTGEPALLTDEMGLPVDLPVGGYTAIMERYTGSDLIVDEQPPIEALDVTCSAAFSVEQGQGPVDIQVTFRNDGCEVAVEEAHAPGAE